MKEELAAELASRSVELKMHAFLQKFDLVANQVLEGEIDVKQELPEITALAKQAMGIKMDGEVEKSFVKTLQSICEAVEPMVMKQVEVAMALTDMCAAVQEWASKEQKDGTLRKMKAVVNLKSALDVHLKQNIAELNVIDEKTSVHLLELMNAVLVVEALPKEDATASTWGRDVMATLLAQSKEKVHEARVSQVQAAEASLKAAQSDLQLVAGGAPDGVVWTSLIKDATSWESVLLAAKESIDQMDAEQLNVKMMILEQDLYLNHSTY